MFAEPSVPDRRPSPGLTLNLPSNNPFRNRASSPAASPALDTPRSTASRPMSRNPFLSTFEAEFNKEAANAAQLIDMSANMKESPKKPTFGSTAEELFHVLLTIQPSPMRAAMERLKHFASVVTDPRSLKQKNLTLDENSGNHKPAPSNGEQRSGAPPPRNHRPSRSQEDEERRLRGAPRGPPRPRGPPGERPPNRHSPDRREHRRPRRNSESSMIDKGSLDPEEERRRRERRRLRDERSKDPKSRSSRVRRPQGLDIIDKLDVTGIYGPSMIHHDGPYDAVQPHRNRKKDHRAPMQAFPANSANNVLGGSGPINKTIDLDTFHGRGAEGFTDFGASGSDYKRSEQDRAISFNPKDRVDIVHGEETVGLGTSTFLEGTPASRTAIQRRESETHNAMADGGLGRKKSIAQRIRGISQPRRQFSDAGRITSPEARYGRGARSPASPQAQSAGGYSKANEQNPFFDDYDKAYDNKSAAIKVAESENKDNAVKSPGPASPGAASRNPLTRAVTADNLEGGAPSEPKPQSGFLSRVKSLKGGRKPRAERPAA
ncbi:Pal1-domain-containing protein [Westerdykella ornata]|uniref:Pal1-domain-containing protein n=1 Tax=Westerdykella ornata TaxID=318751 RepID=A0A6A6JKP8_WESOR|nr:Pal1-domain-containing protein [Westerdykella ornata]KAF2275459.1 Pal1-domain-containing protein [Westerdykella ornata]